MKVIYTFTVFSHIVAITIFKHLYHDTTFTVPNQGQRRQCTQPVLTPSWVAHCFHSIGQQLYLCFGEEMQSFGIKATLLGKCSKISHQNCLSKDFPSHSVSTYTVMQKNNILHQHFILFDLDLLLKLIEHVTINS